MRMSRVRIAVEWMFGKVVNLFAFVDFTKNQKLFKQQVAVFYVCAVFLTNCHTCCYNSVCSDYFSTTPPSLAAYLETFT